MISLFLIGPLGESHPAVAVTLSRVAGVDMARAKCREAAESSMRAYQIFLRTLGGEHPETLKQKNNLGFVFGRLGEFDIAEFYLTSALAAGEEALRA